MARNPKPTALKLLQGNPGHRPLNKREPKPALGAAMPEWMTQEPALVVEWQRQSERLLRLGLLTEIDDDALAVLCVLEVRFRGMVEKALPRELALISKELRALWSRFGMTPADRVRVKTEQPAEVDPFEAYLGKQA